MNRTQHHPRYAVAFFLGKVMLVALYVCAAGWAAPSVAAPQQATLPTVAPLASGTSTVQITQWPLTVRSPIPPNIVLMLDDSGSMRWDVMPDYGSLSSTSQAALVNHEVNGVYYNPNVTYVPPPQLSGKPYPDSSFTDAPTSGFTSSSHTVNLSTYRGRYDTTNTQYNGSAVRFSISEPKVDADTYSIASRSCPDGSDKSQSHPGYCYYLGHDKPESHFFNFYDIGNQYYYTTRCNSIQDVYNASDDTCTPGISFFTYTTRDSSGNYTRHYVAADAGDCEAADLSSDICTADAEVQQNVANWFSYYHTRILLAKSGVLKAFYGVSPKYRIGFGSINNGESSYITNNLAYTEKRGKYIANVEEFGNGDAGTQKAYFWNWITNLVPPEKGTPLRRALQGVGEYYETKQPWKSKDASGQTQILACRQSYTILTTDGFWNGPSPGVGDVDGSDGPTIVGPDQSPFTYQPRAPYTDGGQYGQKNTLADVAMKYWESDLRDQLPNEVPTNNADPAFWQHMVTFTMGMGFIPKDKAGNPIDSDEVQALFNWARTGNQPKTLTGWHGWPKPSASSGGSINNISDLIHAGIDGHGGFYSAVNPQSFVHGLKTALKRAKERTGSGSSLAANSTSLQEGAVLFQALYHTSVWSGGLKAITIDPNTGKLAGTEWNAADKMPQAAERNIWTYVPGTGAWSTTNSGSTIALKNDGGSPPALSNAELTALGQYDANPHTNVANAVSIINYLRGSHVDEQSHDGGEYRVRTGVLGDIVNSQPVFVGEPIAGEFYGEKFKGSSKYLDFVNNHDNRLKTIYVAANDGMLHAFNAATGKEIYAFLPGSVITHGGKNGTGQIIGVSELANPDYGSAAVPHQYFNDGQLTVAEAYFTTDDSWHTVLVGTTGRGLARTVYALDVTNPKDIKLLWERSAWDSGTNSGYIGQMTGKPVIAQVANGQWVVLIGNGYNSTKGMAALLQFNLATGKLSVYTTNATTGNGLAAPGVWIGNLAQGLSTVAYAGDLHGNVWSFQLGKTPAGDGSATTRLFTATDAQGNAQPITVGVLLGRDPNTGYRWAFFGTGRYLSEADISNDAVQSWYGLIVKAPGDPDLVKNLKDKGRVALAKRAIVAQFPGDANAGKPATRVVSLVHADSTESIVDKSKSGWYMDLRSPKMAANTSGQLEPTGDELPPSGERMVVTNQFFRGHLIGTSIIPGGGDACHPAGTGWTMAIQPFTGTNPLDPFFDINGNGQVGGNDKKGVTMPGSKKTRHVGVAAIKHLHMPNGSRFISKGKPPGPGGGPKPPPGPLMCTGLKNGSAACGQVGSPGSHLTRVSWREVVN